MLPAGFATGCATYDDHVPGDDEPRIVVTVKLESGAALWTPAVLDTGAPFNVISNEVADAMGLVPGGDRHARLTIRGTEYRGEVVRAAVTFLATQAGRDLRVDGTFFVYDVADLGPWTRQPPVFIGYGGALAGIRFAVDACQNLFWFGPCADARTSAP